jgi:two-component system, LytTR family, response regulator
VDDERPARRKLRRLLDGAPGVERVFEAPSGWLALEVLEEFEPDLMFLDIRMPGMDGFQLVETLPRDALPEVIFVTAHDEHAVRAFEVRAVDYLLKPFDQVRFQQALERGRAAVEARRRQLGPGPGVEGASAEVVAALRQALAGDRPTRLLVESHPGRKVLLSLERVIRVEADRNDAVFHAAGRTYRLRTTLADLEARLDPERFLRINRSELVNLDRVVELEPLDHGDFRVHLETGEVRRLSRRYRDRMGRFR